MGETKHEQGLPDGLGPGADQAHRPSGQKAAEVRHRKRRQRPTARRRNGAGGHRASLCGADVDARSNAAAATPIPIPTTVSARRRIGCCQASCGLSPARTITTTVVIPVVTTSSGARSRSRGPPRPRSSAPCPRCETAETPSTEDTGQTHHRCPRSRQRGSRALLIGSAKDKQGGDRGPHSTELVVGLRDGVNTRE